jgi:hypothetical protein
MKLYDDTHPEGVEVTAPGMAHRFHQALSTRGAEGDPSAPLKVFLFYNALSIIDYLREQA